MKKFKCVICGQESEGIGANPEPVKPYEEGRCCDACDRMIVIPKRIEIALANRG